MFNVKLFVDWYTSISVQYQFLRDHICIDIDTDTDRDRDRDRDRQTDTHTNTHKHTQTHIQRGPKKMYTHHSTAIFFECPAI
jgi:hypothetical protein